MDETTPTGPTDPSTEPDGGTREGPSGSGSDGFPRAQDIDRYANRIGDRSGSALERMGFSRMTGGILLLALGILVLVYPGFVALLVGVASLLLGVLVLASTPGP